LNKDIKQLTELQVIDLEISMFDAEIKAEQEALAKSEEAFNERQASIIELKEKIEAAEAQRRALEAELADETDRIKERQSKMMQVQTNREYQSLLKEIEDGKKNMKEKEEEIISITETCEANRKIMAEQENLTSEEQEALEEKSANANKQSAKIERKKKKFVKQREAMAKDIDTSVLRKYDMLRTRRNGKAVVGVIKGVCQGCFMSIPPQHYNNILKGDKVFDCPTCQRILFHNPESTEE
jgi:predicted  nucleic acid-binding Zn-ribbon protein